MKKYAGVIIALWCGFFAGGSPASAATGIAFDQITEFAQVHPLPHPADFERVWTQQVGLLKAHAAESPAQRVREYGQALSVASLGDWIRTVDPIGGTTVIERPDLHEAIDLYPDKKYFVYPLKGTHDIYSVTTGQPAQAPPAAAPRVTAKLRVTKDAMPASTLDGFVENGFAERVFQSADASGPCKFAQQAAFVIVFDLPELKEPVLSGDSYGAPFNFAAGPLSVISGCNVATAPDFMTAFPSYPAFLLYKAFISATTSQDLTFVSLPDTLPVYLLMRGHLRKLTDADKGLFEIPAGYTHITSPE